MTSQKKWRTVILALCLLAGTACEQRNGTASSNIAKEIDVQEQSRVQIEKGLKAIKKMNDNSPFGALSKDIKIELKKVTLFPTDVPGTYTGHCLITRSGGLLPMAYTEKLPVKARTNGKDVEVVVYNLSGENSVTTFSDDSFSIDGFSIPY